MPVVGGEEPRALGAQRCVLGRGERRVGGEHCTGRVARVVDGGHVRAEVGDMQRRQAVLPVAEKVTRPALAQVGLRDLKAVGRVAQHLQPRARFLRVRVRHEYAVRLKRPAPLCGIVALCKSQNSTTAIIGIVLCALAIFAPYLLAEYYVESAASSIGNLMKLV